MEFEKKHDTKYFYDDYINNWWVSIIWDGDWLVQFAQTNLDLTLERGSFATADEAMDWANEVRDFWSAIVENSI